MEEAYEGYRKDAFCKLVLLVSKNRGWNITTDLLETDASAARNGDAFGVMDSSRANLDIAFRGKTFKAEFYAADSYAKRFPSAASISAFSKIENFILDASKKR